ncbi:hypothetical protein ACH5RR_034558 [Cinchona calisaya]|uniref:Late embryogenesis abundant protein LEA-2 subgroup domain-containing protein n=1 Tax=Cinchona calisaya TaxID=153742 RepID=A0ABD2YB97_9GENT
MEEREHQPSRGRPGNHNSSLSTSNIQNLPIANNAIPLQSQDFEQVFGPGTYIVQVLKDQIFRVPPSKNGSLARNIDYNQLQKSHCCCSRRFCLCILVIVIILIFAIVGVICIVNIFLIYHDPSFQIEHVTFKKPPPQFDLRLKVENRNKYQIISYDQDSDISLSFKQKEIGDGKFQNFDQDPKNSTILEIVLHGSNLPEESKRSMNGIPLSLSMDLGMKLKVGALNVKSKRIKVSCSLTADGLDKNSHILAQDCGKKG